MTDYSRRIGDGSLPKVGLNTFEIPEEEDTLLKEVVEGKIEPCWSRIEEIKRFKESRDQARSKDVRLEVCEKSKDEEENLRHITKGALLAGATMGEIAGMMRIAYGVPYDPLGMIESPI
jgi:methylmalonyl-CoA mutase N-terminal domain/subunit